MIKMNLLMQELLSVKDIQKADNTNIIHISKDIVGNTKQINGCVIFDREGIVKEENINWDLVLKVNKDLTGYEVSCNELTLSIDSIPISQILHFICLFNFELSNKFRNRNFGIIAIIDSGMINLRFHTYRENEGLWLTDDFEKYMEPIIYCI